MVCELLNLRTRTYSHDILFHNSCNCPLQVRDAAMCTEMQRVRMRHTAAAPSCLAAVYFHTVGSIPRVTKKSLIDGFQLSTRFWLFLSRVRSRGHWQSVSFEFPCAWARSQADIAAPVLLTLQPAAHAFKAVQKEILPLAKKGGFTGARPLRYGMMVSHPEARGNFECWLLRQDLQRSNFYWFCNNENNNGDIL